jgi:hypothetical protein
MLYCQSYCRLDVCILSYALFVDEARRWDSSRRHLFARFVYCFDQVSKHRLSTALIDHLHRLPTVSIRLVITIYLLHLLTRLETRRHIEMARLSSKPHIFSPPSPAAYTNHLHRLPTASIKSVIIANLLHLPTGIEARTHTKSASLQAEKHAFSPPSLTVYLNHLHRLPTASIKSATTVYLMHLPRDRGENSHQIGIPTGRNACIFSPIPNCLHDVIYTHSIAYSQSRLAQ